MTAPTLSLIGDTLLLTFPSHSVRIPCSERGVEILREVLIAWQMQAKPEIGTSGLPTQSIIDAWLGKEENNAKLLAGKHKRRADIQAATGVVVRDRRGPMVIDLTGVEIRKNSTT